MTSLPDPSVDLDTSDGEVVRQNGAFYLSARVPLRRFPLTLCDCLARGAEVHPRRWLAASRDASGIWQGISYEQMLERALTIGRAFTARGLDRQRPIVMLSGNDVEHLQLLLAAMFAGIPVAPLSPAWSLSPSDLTQLRHAVNLLNPSLVFAADGVRFAAALDAVAAPGRLIVTSTGTSTSTAKPGFLTFSSLLTGSDGILDDTIFRPTPDTVVKILFTSGSTGMPKAVPTTHRMLCSNQQMLLQTLPALGQEPPVIVDWLPWHHTYGGSHNLGVALYNGGTFYIDAGKPTEGEFPITVSNLRTVAPTVHFNVPKGWDMLADALHDDPALARMFFSKVQTLFFGGAGLSQTIRDKLDTLSERYRGVAIPIASGLGMTETSPACLFSLGDVAVPNHIGLPAPGCKVKLVPVDDTFELRYQGPHVMRGYLFDESPSASVTVFDEEGYFCSGDTASFVDASQPALGLQFTGRLGEDFKLNSGTFVKVAALRTKAISIDRQCIQDIVVTGHNHADIGMLVFPKLSACRRLANMPDTASALLVLNAPLVLAHFANVLAAINRCASGSATFVRWLALIDEPLSRQTGEITDKGSVNTKAVLRRRQEMVDALHTGGETTAIVVAAE